MKNDLARDLDECLAGLAAGRSIDQCLDDYPGLRSELEPLLRTACQLTALPQAHPSEAFRQDSSRRLLSRLNAESAPRITGPALQKSEAAPRHFSTALREAGGAVRAAMQQALNYRPLLYTTAVLAAVLVCLAVVHPFLQPSGSGLQASEITLSSLKGTTELLAVNSTVWSQVEEPQTMAVGDRIQTGVESSALITLVNGTTVKLAASTELVLTQNSCGEDQVLNIVLTQNAGQTWTHIPDNSAALANLKIITPAADLSGEGNSFLVEVDPDGLTRVAVYAGELQVVSRAEAVELTSDQQIEVSPGMAPQPPQTRPASRNQLVCTAGSAAALAVVDPDGSGTGFGSDGEEYNQISRSSLLESPDGKVIEIDDPENGVYSLVVHSREEAVNLTLSLQNSDQTVTEYNLYLEENPDNGWLVTFEIESGADQESRLRVLSTRRVDAGGTPEISGTGSAEDYPSPTGVEYPAGTGSAEPGSAESDSAESDSASAESGSDSETDSDSGTDSGSNPDSAPLRSDEQQPATENDSSPAETGPVDSSPDSDGQSGQPEERSSERSPAPAETTAPVQSERPDTESTPEIPTGTLITPQTTEPDQGSAFLKPEQPVQ